MIRSTVEKLITTSRGDTRSRLEAFRRGQWLDPEAARADQMERLGALVEHAALHTVYYREVMEEAGVWTPDAGADLDRFAQLPVLDKTTARTRFDDLVSDDLATRTWHYDSTGGSTGEPVRLVRDTVYGDWSRAMSMAVDEITNCDRAGRKLVIWGSVRDLEGHETWRARLGRWLRNEAWLNSFNLNPQIVSSYVEFMNSYRPDYITAYVESIVELARFVDRNGLSVHSPRSIKTAAGCLQPHMRELLARVFRTEVYDHYGSREASWLGTECDRHEGLHVPLQSVYIEVLRDDGTPAAPGETGHIVVTSLINYAMPLIRYAIGDLGSWAPAPCSCGRAWPLLQEVTGRVSDTFVKADGTLVAGEYFNYVFYLQDWVERFQVVQEAVDEIHARVVVRTDLADAEAQRDAALDEIVHKVHLALGPECKVVFDFVDQIEPCASGKYRFTISKVPRPTLEGEPAGLADGRATEACWPDDAHGGADDGD
jgi:phenylacetate-CoA ligase